MGPDHTSKILHNYLGNDCIDCINLKFDGDDEFVSSVKYAKGKGTSVVLASKIDQLINN